MTTTKTLPTASDAARQQRATRAAKAAPRKAAAKPKAAAASKPPVATGPTPEMIDAAVTQLAEEMGGTTDDATKARVKAAAAAKAERVAADAKAAEDAGSAAAAAKDAARWKVSERHQRAIEMRKAGSPVAAIAKELGYANSGIVSNLLKRHAPELVGQGRSSAGPAAYRSGVAWIATAGKKGDGSMANLKADTLATITPVQLLAHVFGFDADRVAQDVLAARAS